MLTLLQTAIESLPEQESKALTPLCGIGKFASTSAERRQQFAASAYGVSRSYFPKAPKQRLVRQLADVLYSWARDADDGEGQHNTELGLIAYFNDFVDIPGFLWETLILESRRFHIVMNYGSTWRNTYRKTLVQAINQGLILEVVLPDCSPKSPLLELHAQRQGVSRQSFKAKVDEATHDLFDISDGHALVYASSAAFSHSAFIFDSSSILGLYTLGGGRAATPAFHVSHASGLDTFVRNDFEELKSSSSPITHNTHKN